MISVQIKVRNLFHGAGDQRPRDEQVRRSPEQPHHRVGSKPCLVPPAFSSLQQALKPHSEPV